MNFVDPKEYNYPGLVRKNRYKTILPSEYSFNRKNNLWLFFLCMFLMYTYEYLAQYVRDNPVINFSSKI